MKFNEENLPIIVKRIGEYVVDYLQSDTHLMALFLDFINKKIPEFIKNENIEFDKQTEMMYSLPNLYFSMVINGLRPGIRAVTNMHAKGALLELIDNNKEWFANIDFQDFRNKMDIFIDEQINFDTTKVAVKGLREMANRQMH